MGVAEIRDAAAKLAVGMQVNLAKGPLFGLVPDREIRQAAKNSLERQLRETLANPLLEEPEQSRQVRRIISNILNRS